MKNILTQTSYLLSRLPMASIWLNSVGLPAKYEDAEVFIRGSYQRMKDELVTSGIIVVEEFEDEEKEL